MSEEGYRPEDILPGEPKTRVRNIEKAHDKADSIERRIDYYKSRIGKIEEYFKGLDNHSSTPDEIWSYIRYNVIVPDILHHLVGNGIIDEEEYHDYYDNDKDTERAYKEMAQKDETTIGDLRWFIKDYLSQYKRLLEQGLEKVEKEKKK